MSNTDIGGGGYGSGTARPEGDASPKEMARQAVQTVKQEAATFAGDVKDKAIEKAEQGKETATQTLGDFADAIRKAGEELSNNDQSMAGRVIAKAADGLESFSRSVSDKRPEELLEAVRDFGRKNPTAFVAGSVLVGLALGRFLKSSGTGSERDAGFAGTGSRLTAPGGAPAFESGSAAGAMGQTSTDMSGGYSGVGGSALGAALDETQDGADDGEDRDMARFEPGPPSGRGPGI